MECLAGVKAGITLVTLWSPEETLPGLWNVPEPTWEDVWGPKDRQAEGALTQYSQPHPAQPSRQKHRQTKPDTPLS